MNQRFLMLLFVAVWALAACQPAPTADSPRTLVVLTHDSFDASSDLIDQFEQQSNAQVNIITAGDAGTLTSQVILNANAPLGDVVYGIDNTFLSRALEADVFEPYQSPLLNTVSTDFQLDDQYRVTPIDYGDVCLNYDRAYFAENNLTIPTTLQDLTDPIYRDLLVVQNPASSSPGLAFLMATVVAFGEEGYLDYWADLRSNGVRVVEDWSAAYYNEFSGGSGGGSRPLVVSYASSPPVEVLFSDPQPSEASTGAIVAPLTCFRQVEFAAILRGSQQVELAQAWIDFMLSPAFQEDIPLKMFVFPVNSEAELPQLFIQHAQIADQPAQLDPASIAANRERWIVDWTNTVLR